MTPRSAADPDVDFRHIRPYGSPPSKADAFEELASIIMRDGLVEWPDGIVFYRFGNPDGGREGKGVLPNHDVWAWQAKYLFAFGNDEIGQLHKSVVRVLDTEPNLKRYYVALPYDLPGGDTDGPKVKKKSAHTKWLEKKAEWEALAASRGMTVEFVYIGAHELLSELTRKSKHAGRLRYWFNAAVLSPDGLKQRLADVVAKAGRRYSPEVHVDVEAVQALEGLGRTEAFVKKVQVALADVRTARAEGWYPPKGDEEAFRNSIKKSRKALLKAEVALESLLEAIRSTGPLPDVVEDLQSVEKYLQAVHRLLQDRHLQKGRYYVDQAGALYSTVRKANEAVWAATSLLRSPEAEAAHVGRLLMTGRAGVGKTHLFCDVATHRITAGLPTLIALGQDFDAGKLLPQICELVQLDGSLDDVLTVLDAAGEAAGCFAMLMIDAVNEGTNAERWVDDLRVLAGAVDRHPNVVLAVSCRTEFLTPVVGDADGFPRVAHQGFAEATSEAVDRYTAEYNLERLTFPVLNPEYGNPLFLKLACEALNTLGETRFTLGTAGLSTVCNAFMEAVNKRLAAPPRCDYDETTNLVQTVVQELAASGPGPYDIDEVRRITEALLPGRQWSKSLLLGLRREGVLMDTYNNQVAFSYQRLGDVVRAMLLAEKSADDLTSWYTALGDAQWEERGTIGALAVIAPEAVGVEIIDLFKDETDNSVACDIIDAFVESLVLRAPQHTTDRTAGIVEQLVDFEEWTDRVWEKLVRVACVPGHQLNAEWTHHLLSARPLPERDSTWSEWLVGATEHDDNAVTVLLDWAWNPRKTSRDTSPLPDDVARLATLIMGWMLTTPDRRVRDRTTKALVCVGERGPAGFATAVRAYNGCDDPYVIERLAAAVCAVALRSPNPAAIMGVADAAVEMVADAWPEHLLTRDYLRRTSAAAHRHGWSGPEWLPPYGAKWPVRAKSAKAIQELDAAPEHRYSSIWGSLHGMLGDFGRYEMEPALDYFDHPDHRKLRSLVERVVFTRVLQLGWTPQRFGHLDRGRHGGHDGPLERYGKKYQWIGFYEALGRIADNYKLRERWIDNVEPFPYEYAEQIVYRDIDPTVLTPGGITDPGDDTMPWFAPAHATFPAEVAKEYPRDLEGVPDPLDLITLTAPDDAKWLSMIRHGSWTQVLPPEIAALRAPNLNVWMQIRGYLVPADRAAALRAFADGQDWDGRWMSENADVHSRLLAAHPGSPDWDWADGNAEPRHLGNRVIPAALFQPVAWYGGTGTSRESAGTEEPTGYVPSRMLFDLVNLRHGTDFHWADADGLAVTDPTAGMAEASTLVMRRDLAGKLAGAGFTLFWTVLLNKQRHDHNYGRPGKKYRWLSASASYMLVGATVELVSAKAWRCRPTPGGDPKPVDWEVRRTG